MVRAQERELLKKTLYRNVRAFLFFKIYVKKNVIHNFTINFESTNQIDMKKLFFNLIITLLVANFRAQNIPMTFHNGSFKSIPLIIPGVMNPNLSPKSNSGVTLGVGQKVYFFLNGKKKSKELLFTVAATWKKDTIFQIDKIIEKRKKELIED